MVSRQPLTYYVNVAKAAIDKSEKDGSNVYSNIHNVLKDQPLCPVRNAGLIKVKMIPFSYNTKKYIFN